MLTANNKLYINGTLILYPINKKTSFFLHMGRVIVKSYLRNPWKVDGCPIYWGDVYLKSNDSEANPP